jgi:hypothetical protein
MKLHWVAHGQNARRLFMRAALVIAGALLIFALPLWAAEGHDGSLLPGAWKEQRLNFLYMGRTARYSCEGLRDKMRALLLVLGARRDLTVSVSSCGGPSSSLSMMFSSPVLEDAAARPLHPGDLAAVDVRYEPFTLSRDPFRNFGIGDCELVEQFVRKILPKFVTRGVQQDITCVPYQLSGSRYFVRGEVLKAVIRP